MSDSDKGFDIFGDVKPYSFEPLAKKVTDSISCEEIAAASAYIEPRAVTCAADTRSCPQQELDWCVILCVGSSLIDKSTY